MSKQLQLFSVKNLNETWKDIPNYKGKYQASTLGRIRNTYTGKISFGNLYKAHKYLQITLTNKKGQRTYKIHQLIAQTFLDKDYRKKGFDCDHIDNNPINNKISNFQLLTHRQNISKNTNPKSKYTGASQWQIKRYNKTYTYFYSKIYIKGKEISLGSFKSALSAHHAYQMALQIIENPLYKNKVYHLKKLKNEINTFKKSLKK